MPSPFPGMNPYLEQEAVWHSLHEQFPAYCQEMLTAQVRPKYFVKLDVNIYIHELPDSQRFLGRPDISLGATNPMPARSGAATLAAPLYGRFGPAIDVVKEAFVEVHERDTRRVVCVIELLSPTNKAPGVDRETYLAKRIRYSQSSVHFVEIDLLRAWQKMPVEDLPECDYCVQVSRAEERPRVGLWPIMLRDRLPTIPIPLLAPDPDARLDLQALLHRLYDAGGYEDYIYSGTPQPPLSAEDADWAAAILNAVGKYQES
ncbi:MAG: DUF4058 family protein [Planctomycetaceae bacterium]|nr:DUF4058 family protein [Planctomycetaceae bacterium]